jgi:hypothetical protein
MTEPGWVPPGSYLVISHGTGEDRPGAGVPAVPARYGNLAGAGQRV